MIRVEFWESKPETNDDLNYSAEFAGIDEAVAFFMLPPEHANQYIMFIRLIGEGHFMLRKNPDHKVNDECDDLWENETRRLNAMAGNY